MPLPGIEWDEKKNSINKTIHHIDFEDAQYVFSTQIGLNAWTGVWETNLENVGYKLREWVVVLVIILFFLGEYSFAQGNCIKEYKASVVVYYLPMDVKTVVPLSPDMLIKDTHLDIEQTFAVSYVIDNIEKNYVDNIKNDISLMFLDEWKETVTIQFPPVEAEAFNLPGWEIVHSPYISTRLVIRFSDDFFIALGTNAISVNNKLFFLNRNFILKVGELLDKLELNKIKLDMFNYYENEKNFRLDRE